MEVLRVSGIRSNSHLRHTSKWRPRKTVRYTAIRVTRACSHASSTCLSRGLKDGLTERLLVVGYHHEEMSSDHSGRCTDVDEEMVNTKATANEKMIQYREKLVRRIVYSS